MKFLSNLKSRLSSLVTGHWSLVTVIVLGAFLRFYKLDWGSGYFFHPDEYHIAAAVERLSFPHQMNPELFSYGSFTVYLIYFTKLFLSFIPSYLLSPISYLLSPILIGRFYSALFSTLTIILVYLIAKKLFISLYLCIFVSFLVALLPGSIQQAHFATPESILTFLLFATLLMSLKKRFYLAAAALGLALGTKVVALTFLPVVFLPLFIFTSPSEEVDYATTSEVARQPACRQTGRPRLLRGEIWKQAILSVLILLLTFFLSFPYAFLDWQSFRSSLNYETGVARGQPVVFYTRQFTNTTPVLFQFQKIFSYALGPGVLILGSLGFLGILGYLGNLRKRKQPSLTGHWSLVTGAFLCYFLPNIFLFAKWTRFMAPIFPFFALFSAWSLSLIEKKKLLRVACYILLILNLVWSLMFFSIYLRPDVRLTATDWVNQNFKKDATILLEGGNMLDIPLYGSNLKKISLDFYALEESSQKKEELIILLTKSDYFIIQSRRVFINHQRLRNNYPFTAQLYDLLFSNQLGFEKTKEFSSFPTLKVRNFRLEINDEMAEETWSVFDHPAIKVYEKTKILTIKDYEKLLKI